MHRLAHVPSARVASASDDKANAWLHTAGWFIENIFAIAILSTIAVGVVLYLVLS